MKTKLLTFLLALTFLFLFIGSSVVFTDDLQDGLEASDQEVQDDVWTAEQTESVGVVASVNGRIVHGDRFKIIIEKNECLQGEMYFTFYTTQNNKEILALKEKIVEIKYNQETIKSEILHVEKIMMGHIVMFHLGFKPLDFIVNFHKNLKNISVALIDGESFKVGDYFDVLENEWSLTNLEASLLNGQSLCINLKQSREDSDTEEVIRLIGLAQKGDPDAQYKLAIMYSQGTIIPKNYKEAVRLFRLSAEQGIVLAQYNLGLMYAKGEGVLQDYTLAHMWWSICGAKLHEGCVKNRYIVEGKLTSEQWKKSMKMAINWQPKT